MAVTVVVAVAMGKRSSIYVIQSAGISGNSDLCLFGLRSRK